MSTTYEKLGQYSDGELPSAPSDAYIDAVTNTQFTLHWTNNITAEDFPTAQLVVQRWQGTYWETQAGSPFGLEWDYEIVAGLSEGTSYRVRVAVLMDDVLYASQPLVQETTSIPKPELSEVDAGTDYVDVDIDGYDESWESLKMYRYIFEGEETGWVLQDTIAATETQYVYTGLTAGENYYVRAGAVIAGTEYFGDYIMISTEEAAVLPATNLVLTENSSDSWVLSWDNNEPATSGYNKVWLIVDGNYYNIHNANAEETSYTFNPVEVKNNYGLSYDTDYPMYVQRDTEDGRDAVDSEAVQFNLTEASYAPTDLILNTVSDNQFQITFTNNCVNCLDAGCDGAPDNIRLYIDDVQADMSEYGEDWLTSLDNLVAGTTYQVQVGYECVGVIQLSDYLEVTTTEAAEAAVQDLAAVSSDETTISISWTKPETEPTGFTYYEIKWSWDVDSWSDTVTNYNTETYQLTGLTASRTYNVEVVTWYDGGTSSAQCENPSSITQSTSASGTTGTTTPVVNWSFDDSVTDSVESIELTANQGTIAYEIGLNSQNALKFDDDNEYPLVLKDNAGSFNWMNFLFNWNGVNTLGRNWSFSFWIKPDLANQADAGYVFYIKDVNNNSAYFRIDENGIIRSYYRAIGGSGVICDFTDDTGANTPIDDNTWTHIAMTFNYNESLDEMWVRGYLNGVQTYLEGVLLRQVGAIMGDTEPLMAGDTYIMGDMDLSGTRFDYPNGLVQYLKFYDEILSDEEVLAIYNDEKEV